jgi:hypothetical protein
MTGTFHKLLLHLLWADLVAWVRLLHLLRLLRLLRLLPLLRLRRQSFKVAVGTRLEHVLYRS